MPRCGFVVALPGSPPRHVLVLDDDPAIHRLLERLLRLHGFKPVLAGSVHDLVTIVQATPIAAFVLDVRLRGPESGLDALAWLRTQPKYEATPILMLTGVTKLEEDEEAIIRRHHAYVFYKPERLHLLIDQLKRLV